MFRNVLLLAAFAVPVAAAQAEPYEGRWRGSADPLTKTFIPSYGPVCATMELELDVTGDRFTAVAHRIAMRKAPRPERLEFAGVVRDDGRVERTDRTGADQPLKPGQIAGDVMTIAFEGPACRYDFTLRRD